MNHEQELLRRAQAGETEAFDELLQPYVKSAYQTAYLLLHRQAWTEDAVQEALLQTFQSLHRFDENRASFKTWFHHIVVRTTLKMRRRKWFTLEEIEVRDERDEPAQRYMAKEESLEIYAAVRKLPMKQQMVIVLFYFQSYSISEIAEVLAIKEGTVKSRLHVAREKLKDLLGEEGAYTWKNN